MARARELRLPALQVRQGKRRLYQFAIPAKNLAEISTVSRIRRTDDGEVAGYQRPEVLRHVAAIRRYLESPGALMPNALVIAFDSRAHFEPVGELEVTTAFTDVGSIVVPITGKGGEEPPGWIVDGQQRAAALREAALTGDFPVPVVAFITDDLREQRAQFILVNNTKPLPKGLIHELLPATEGELPVTLLRKRFPAKLLSLLNIVPGSPMEKAIRTPTMPDGRIRDTSVLKMIENSITDGALYTYRDPKTGDGDTGRMLEVLWNFWTAVAETWPEAWVLPPRKSRLTHGVGIVALGAVMDEITDRHGGADSVPATAVYREHLRSIAGIAAWTRGQWDFGLREHRPWNELQNTSKDIVKLTDLLLRTYRAAVPRMESDRAVA